MSKCTKGKLQASKRDGYTNIHHCGLQIAMVTGKNYLEDAVELVRRWNAFETSGSHKALVDALEKTTKYLFVKTKPQSKYSTSRYVDTLMEENAAVLALVKQDKNERGNEKEESEVSDAR